MKQKSNDIQIIVLGNGKAGKTNLLNKFTSNIFSESYKATIISDYSRKIFEADGKIYGIKFWVLAGQDKNKSITKTFAKGSHGFIVVTDATNKETIEE